MELNSVFNISIQIPFSTDDQSELFIAFGF